MACCNPEKKDCSGECGVDCPCALAQKNSPTQIGKRQFFGAETLVALADNLIENGRPMTMAEAQGAMEAVRCPDCGKVMPRILAARHTC